jgi:5'-deoxynucleotidase YfbR-like HD superfamily hydrolase
MSDETIATGNGETQTTIVEETTATSTAAPETTTTAIETAAKDNSLKAVLGRNFDKLTAKAGDTTQAPAATSTAAPAGEMDPITGRKLDPIKAPQSVPLAMREKWAAVPREFQEFWAKRENDINTRLTQTAEDRKFADRFKTVLQPYSEVFKQHGVDSVQHVHGLLQVNHALHAGTPEQRAQILFNLVNQFIGQDPKGRQVFGGLLTGKVQHIPAAQGVPTAPEKSVDQLVEERMQSKSSEAELASGATALDAFLADPANEFADDQEIRDLMGTALEAGLVKGDTWADVWKNAYAFACSNHQGVKTVLAGRQTQQSTTAAVTTTTTPTKPVQSVKPSAGAGTRTNANMKGKSLREQLEAAMDQHGS